MLRATGIHASLLGRYEKGQRTPKTDALLKIAKTTGASFEWLHTGEGDMFSEHPAPGHPDFRISQLPPEYSTVPGEVSGVQGAIIAARSGDGAMRRIEKGGINCSLTRSGNRLTAILEHRKSATVEIGTIKEERRRIALEVGSTESKVRYLLALASAGEWGEENVGELKGELTRLRSARDAARSRLPEISKRLKLAEKKTQRPRPISKRPSRTPCRAWSARTSHPIAVCGFARSCGG